MGNHPRVRIPPSPSRRSPGPHGLGLVSLGGYAPPESAAGGCGYGPVYSGMLVQPGVSGREMSERMTPFSFIWCCRSVSRK